MQLPNTEQICGKRDRDMEQTPVLLVVTALKSI